jgi:BlaI family transcriptional regulator, penicillinase repressor
MERPKPLSELQIALMRVLWQRGEATVADLYEALKDTRGLAITTIATILSRLEKQGVVTHRTVSRQFIYRPLISEQDARRSMVADLIDNLFQGDSAALVSHLLSESEIGPDDLAHVKQLIMSYVDRKAGQDAE